MGKLVGWGNTPNEPAFGASNDAASVKGKLVNLISSVRTLMRSEISPSSVFYKRRGKGSSWLLCLSITRWKLEGVEDDDESLMGLSRREQMRNHANGSVCDPVPLIVINTLVIVYELVLG